VVRRHEALRTTFPAVDGRPVQRIAPPAALAVPLVDLTALPAGARDRLARSLVHREALRPFDLGRGPLVRACLLRLGAEEHAALFTLHHIVADGWSMGILVREVAALYAALLERRPAALQPLPLQYADFAVWQQEHLADRVLGEQLAAWRQRLAGAPLVLELPADHPRPPMPSGRGGTRTILLPAELSAAAGALGRREGATLFMVLLAAFDALLHRTTGRDDLIVGTDVANRNRAETEGVIGFFINQLALRVDLAGDPPFRELLARVRETALAAYAHQDLPFERLVEELQPERDLSRQPIFQVAFVLQNVPVGLLHLPGLTLSPLEGGGGTAKLDLTVVATETPSGCWVNAEYATDLFDPPTIDRLLGHLATLLAAAVDDPSWPLSTLPLLPAAERQQVLIEWNDSRLDFPASRPFIRLFAERAAATPEAIAAADPDGRLTYADLAWRASRLSAGLAAGGVGPESLVALLADRGLDFLSAVLGIFRAGGAYLPLDPQHPRMRLAQLVAASGARVAVASRALAAGLAEAVASLPAADRPRLLVLEDLLERPAPALRQPPKGSLAYVIYTSGSTGAPKGAMVEQRGMLNHLQAKIADLGLTAADVVAQTASQCFDISVWQLLAALLAGGRVEIFPDEVAHDPLRLLAEVERRSVTVLETVPSLLRLLIEDLEARGADRPVLGRLRWMIPTGEALPPDLCRRWLLLHPRIPLLNAYGPTECSDDVTHHPIHEIPPGDELQTPIGRPVPNLRLYVLDPGLEPAPAGVPGELFVGGAGVGRGYLGDGARTAQAFIPDPFSPAVGARLYRTGDLGRRRPDGTIEFLGRRDHQVKIRGHRIELGEIEAVLARHPGVRAAAVVAREDAPGDKRLAAYVVPQPEDGAADRAKVGQWESVFDEVYTRGDASERDEGINLRVWVSSYTGETLPEEEIFECFEDSVARILALAPRRTLEIGCGTGLLLLRIAPQCESYCGTDVSSEVLRSLERRVERQSGLPPVELFHRAADDLTGIPLGAWDTVVLNEVAQYFPSGDYLAHALQGAIAAAAPGGRVFAGGLRSLPLLAAFHASVQLHQAPADLPVATLYEEVLQRTAQEKELLVDPALFAALAANEGRVTGIEIQLKGGRHRNELTKFRYDVVLRVGENPAPPAPACLLDGRTGWTAEGLRHHLEAERPEAVLLQGVPNARLAEDLAALELVRSGSLATAGEVREALQRNPPEPGIEPADLWELGRGLGYEVEIRWSAAGPDLLDVCFRRPGTGWPETPDARAASGAWGRFTNNPARGLLAEDLVPRLRAHLAERLPESMMPSAFVLLDELPLTPNGKLDRRALPAPDQARPALDAEYATPRLPAEEALARIWAQVLRLDRVGVHDNFFELGGDSILSIQVVTRANQAGLRLTPRQMFQYQSIAELAAVAGTVEVEVSEQGPVTGELPLTPIQRWFFEQGFVDPAHWNQAVLLATRLDPGILARAFDLLLAHHDALRLRFSPGGARQVNAGPGEATPFTRIDLSALLAEARSPAVAAGADQVHEALDLERGPIARMAVFDLGADAPRRVQIVIHHLAVDGVSWRILLEDLTTACRALTTGEEPVLPAKTLSFKEWAHRLAQHVLSGAVESEADDWLSPARSRVAPLPVDHAGGENMFGSVRGVTVQLSPEETQALLQEVPRAYRTQINDALLTALARSLAEWTGRREALVDVEAHGREELFGEADLSRTVGWFTSEPPMLLEVSASGDPGEDLRTVKEQLRAVPGRGVGHGLLRYLRGGAIAERLAAQPRAELIFNYLGQLDQATPEDGLFGPAPEPPGAVQSRRERRAHLVEVTAGITGGRLGATFLYSARIHRHATLEALAGRFVHHLRELIAHCRAAVERQVARYTPADFPLARLGQADLDRLLGTAWGIEDLYPLSPLQEGILFESVSAPAVGIYVEQVLCRLAGAVDREALAAAARRIVERHPILRTTFHWQLDRPLQAVHARGVIELEEEDWRGLDPAEQEHRTEALLHADRARGFDLGRLPLLRWRLVRLAEDHHRLLWTHHHILLDGWSFGAVIGEFLASYGALRRGSEPQLPRRRPYRDYIAWLETRDPAGAEEHWRRMLAGWSEPTPLGIGREAAGLPPGHATRTALVPATVASALQAQTRRLQVTLNTLLSGAWAALLGRTSGHDDVVFGTTVSGRSADVPGVEEMVGLFINTLPLRLDVAGAQRLAPWLQDLQLRQAELIQHEHTPLAKVQAWSEVPRGVRLFDSILVFENWPLDGSLRQGGGSGLGVAEVRALEQTGFPLTLVAVPGPEILLRMEHDPTRIDSAAAARTLAHVAALLEGLAESPLDGRRIEDLPLLSAMERHQLLNEWNDTARTWPAGPPLLHRLIEDQVDRTPGALAVIFEDEELTYRDLDLRADRIASRLRRLGVGPEVLVGVCMERSAELLVALLAVLKAGGAYVPFDPDLPHERLAFLLADTRTPVVLTQLRLAGRIPPGAEVVCADGALNGEEQEPADREIVPVHPENLAYTIYTSGSTGRPKGAMNTHAAIVNRLLWMGEEYRIDAGERVLQKTPFSFDVSVWELFKPLLFGATLVVARPEGHKDPTYLADLIGRRQVTTLHFVPSMLRAFLEEEGLERCTSIRRVVCSGEALPFDLQERLFARLGAELHNLYGPTEAAVDVTSHRCAPGDPRGIVPIGRPIANLRIHLLGRDLRPVPAGVPGELAIGGAGLARGYLGRPDLTAERFLPDATEETAGGRLYRTGDLARWLSDGSIEFLGRLDFQVKIRGFRIELGEVEAALLEHSRVKEAVVVARDLARGQRQGQSLVAYVVPRGGEADVSELREALLRRLPQHMVPAAFVVLPTLPLTRSGKVDRKALPAPERGAGPTRRTLPQTATEELLARIWAEVLGLEQVGLDESFFELGGDSILSLQVASRAARAGCRVTPRQIFEHPTVAALAAVAGAAATPAASQGPVSGPVPLTPIQHWFFAAEPVVPHHFNQSLLLAPRLPVTPQATARAFAALVEHHDALRLRFRRTPEGWRQWNEPPAVPGKFPWHRIDLSALPPSRAREERLIADRQAQASLDLQTGPIARAVWFDLAPGEPRLLLVIHHLAVDGVSWRILVSDLETLCRGGSLPPKTTSFQLWAERLEAHARTMPLEPELSWWLSTAAAVPAVPMDFPAGANTVASTRRVGVELSAEETRALLHEVPATGRTQIQEVLLTALAQGLGGAARIDLEGHGREDVVAGVDLARTVGWLTALYPVRLETRSETAADPGAALRAVKETLRSLPGRGLGWGLLRYLRGERAVAELLASLPAPQVIFNYAGQLDRGGPDVAAPGASLFGPAEEITGAPADPRERRSHPLAVEAVVQGGRLQVDWLYSANLHRRETVEALAAAFLARLRELIAHFCGAAETADAAYAPSDFPLAGLGARELERVLGGEPGIEDLYPLAPLQEGILFETLYAPGSGVYVGQMLSRLRGPLDAAALEEACQWLVGRHPLLRTSFRWQQLARPLQAVHRKVEVRLEREDLRGLPLAEQERRLEELLAADRARGFDPARPPLMRWTLIATGEDKQALLWTHHHVLLDGWSFSALIGELLTAYGAARAGRPPQAPRRPPYRDFIAWLERQDPAAREEHWRRALAGWTEPTPLAASRPERGRPGSTALWERLSPDDTAALQAAARRHQLTLNALVQAAWGTLLSRYSGREDVVFGVTLSGRSANLPDIEAMIGLFINTLPLRVSPAGREPLLPWLRDLRRRQTELMQHEHTPLVDVQGWSEVPRGTPLFASILVFESFPRDAAMRQGQGALGVADVRVREQTQYPLTVTATPEERLLLGLEHANAAFDSATARRLLEHFRNLLAGLVPLLAGSGARLADLPLLAPAERQQILEGSLLVPVQAPVPVHELFAARAAERPDAIALVCGDRRLTYGELHRAAGRLAARLRGRGVGPEVFVGVCVERSVEMVVALLGVLQAGGAYVPLDPHLPADRLAFLLEDSGVRVVLTLERLAGMLPEHGASVLLLDRPDEGPLDASRPALDPGHPAYAIYTSGSTGRPKGVVVTHANVSRLLAATTPWFGFSPGDVWTLFHSYAFDFSVWEIWGALAHGGRLVVVPWAVSRSPEAFLDLLAEEGVTVLNQTPSAFRQLSHAEEARGGSAPRALALREVIFGGEALELPSLAPWIARHGDEQPRLINMYGITETTVHVTFRRVTRADLGLGSLVGVPIPDLRVYLLDAGLELVPFQAPGEICVGGAGLARGYLGRPDLTAERFVPDPFGGLFGEPGARLYSSGDLAHRWADGDLEYLGRRDQQVKIRGFRIEPGEIESALAAHPALREAVVVARELAGDRQLVAYVVPRAGAGVTAAELRAHLRERLPDYMMPGAFVLLETLPLTPHGKVDRRALPEPDRSAAVEARTAPRDPAEELLAGIFAEVLRLDQVGIDQSFFELGGHSLLATRVASRVREAFGVDLPLRDVFEEPTVAGLAARVRSLLAAGSHRQEPPIVPVPRTGDLPLSFAQERLWFLDRLSPGSAAYNIPLALGLRGTLSVPALTASLAALAERHEALRTTFAESGGRPVQVIAPPAPAVLPVVDLQGLPEAARRGAALALAGEEARRPFDLGAGPLLRVTLLLLEPAGHVALFNVHHIVSDEWSMGVLVRELGAHYEAALQGREALLPPLPVQYADFAVWQRAWLSGEVLDEQLAWWKERLSGAPPVLDLPLDRPRPAVQTFRGAAVPVRVSAEVAGRLAALGRSQQATSFMLLLAGFQALLSRLTGQEDLVVGTPVANRNRMETEGLIGFFVNTLALRAGLAGDPAFPEQLERVRETALSAYVHQDLPFEKLVEELHPRRSLSQTPVFQVMFLLEEGGGAALELPGLSLEPFGGGLGETGAKFDLTLSLAQAAGGLSGALELNADLFDATTGMRMASQLETLLAGVAKQPERRLSELPLLAPAERHQLLIDWNDTASGDPRARRAAHELFAEQAARTPEAVALISGGEELTYGDLDRRARRVAAALRQAGVAPGSVVGLCAERTPEMVAGLLGIWKAGGVFLPLDPEWPAERLAFLLDDSGASAVLTQERLAARLSVQERTVALLESLPEEDGAEDGVTADPERLAYILYTSGSTGRPKGVLVEHRQLAHTLAASRRAHGWSADDSIACVSPFSFDIFLFELLNPLLAGGRCHLLPLSPSLDLDRLAALLPELTRLHAVPAVMRQVVESAERSRRSGHPHLRTLFVGGDAVPLDLLVSMRRAFPRAEIRILYGPTEATIIATDLAIAPGAMPVRSTLGRPLGDVEILLCDRHGNPVPIGVAGEILIGGPGVIRGYLDRPELTAERFPRRDGRRLYRTGDLARRLADGELEFLGRADQQVKIRGFRIELEEVEAALAAQPGVRSAAAVVQEDPAAGRLLAAFVVPAEGAELAPSGLREGLRSFLPDYMLPARLTVLAALPLTVHGKVDRRALAGLRPEEDASAAPEAPRTPAEEMVAGMFAALLRQDRVGRAESFFDLGGHSLLAAQLASRVREAFGVELPLRALFEEPTAAALAARVEQLRQAGPSDAPPPLVPVLRTESLPLSFAQQRLWFLHQLDPQSPAYNMPFGFRLGGRLSVPALAHALDEVARRHETLRTTLPSVAGRPVQAIAPPAPLPLPVVDLRALPPEPRAAEAMRLAAEEAAAPFDLARPPVVRLRLLSLADDDHALLFTVHHVTADAWSMDVLAREVATLYAAAVSGRELRLPALPVQYADYAVWQRGWLQGEVLAEQMAWWRDRLAGAPEVLELPLDRPRPPFPTFRGGREVRRLSAEAAQALRALGRSEGSTLFMTLLAAFSLLLHRASGQETVVVGTPVANRGRLEIEGLIGFFANTLALSTDLGGDPPFRGLLRQVRETALGAYAHQDLPFEKLVEELRPRRDLSHPPIFQVLLAFENAPPPGARRETALAIEPFGGGNESANFDLVLACADQGEGLDCALDYNADLFDRSTAERMLRLFAHVLATATASPGSHLSALPPLDEEEMREVVLAAGAAGKQRAFPAAGRLHELFELQVERTPEAPAVLFEGAATSYGELDRTANRIARLLRRLGVGPETRVAIAGERSPSTLAAMLGVLKAGGAWVPLDPEAPRERLADLIADVGAQILLTQERLAEPLAGLAAHTLAVDALGAESPERLPIEVPADGAAYVIYTSGSTGLPKGVVVPHRAVAHFTQALAEAVGLAPDDRILLFAPLSFDASVLQIFPALASGASIAVHKNPRELSPAEILAFCECSGVTVLDLPAALWRLWVDEAAARRAPLPAGLRAFLTGGESVPVAKLRAWAELGQLADRPLSFLSSYGPTEATVTTTAFQTTSEKAGALTGDVVPIGRPLPDVRAWLLDTRMQPVPRGVPGELYLGGAGLARGYLGRPDLTAEAFLPDPLSGESGRLYRTGDCARHRPDGELDFLGRADHQVKIRGFRLELAEVEAALARHPGVREAVALVREDRPGDRRLVAWVDPEPGERPSPADLRAFLAERLPQHAVPSAVLLLDALPTLPSGKVDRAALPTPEPDRSGVTVDYAAPRNAVEQVLASLWAPVLGVERVGVHDDFFELGGHSLLATQVVARVREELEVDLELRHLFEAPTVAGLAAALLADPDRRDRIERAAALTLELSRMSDDEIEAMLATEAVDSPEGS